MKQLFKEDLNKMLHLIAEAESLAFARFADGEASVLKNLTVGNKDGWLFKKDRNLSFRRDLRNSLLCTDPNYYYGISCSCCDPPNHKFLLDLVNAPLSQLTFSNLWVNANYPIFNQHFIPAIVKSSKKIILCTGAKAKVKDFSKSVPIADFIPIHGNCVLEWESRRDFLRGLMDLKATENRGAIFLFAIGPLSEVFIHQMWQANPRNVYIDIGSTLDPLLFRRNSRDYHKGDAQYSARVCEW